MTMRKSSVSLVHISDVLKHIKKLKWLLKKTKCPLTINYLYVSNNSFK